MLRILPHFASLTASALIGGLLLPLTANAITFVEVGDAGDQPGSAQVVSGVTPLTAIQGTLGAGDIDMFRIHLNGGAFSATVGIGGDSQLFLFDSTGRGLLANDDIAFPSISRSGISGSLPEGDYFLAISEFDNDPLSAGGLIFPNSPFDAILGPTGPGGASPIIGWSAFTGPGFGYQIDLVNASSVPTDPGQGVPDESSSLVLMALSGIALFLVRRRA